MPFDADGDPDRRPDTHRAVVGSDGTGERFVWLDAGGTTGLPDECGNIPATDAQRRREGSISIPGPAADGCDLGALGVVTADEDVVRRMQVPDLARYGGENVVRRRALRNERRYPSQTCLLVCQRCEIVTAALQRLAHEVERPLQRSDLGHAGLGQSRAEVTAGETVRHGCGTSNRPDDRARQVGG